VEEDLEELMAVMDGLVYLNMEDHLVVVVVALALLLMLVAVVVEVWLMLIIQRSLLAIVIQ